LEVAKERLKSSDVKDYAPLIYPKKHNVLLQLYVATGMPKEDIFVSREDGIDDLLGLLVEGSQKLAETGHVSVVSLAIGFLMGAELIYV
jgi:hypothetical protein